MSTAMIIERVTLGDFTVAIEKDGDHYYVLSPDRPWHREKFETYYRAANTAYFFLIMKAGGKFEEYDTHTEGEIA